MDAWSGPLFAIFMIAVVAGLAAVDKLFGNYDDKDDWRRK